MAASDIEPAAPGEELDYSMPRADQTSVGRWLIETALVIMVAAVLAMAVKTFVLQPFVIPTGSMIPTISIGNYVLAEKITYRFVHSPSAGDVVVFDDPNGQHPQLIKRVIAVAGQEVDIRENRVWVDGEPLDEPYTHGQPSVPGTIETPMTVPAGEVWLMGDNRPNSGDSRYFGSRPVSTIRGRAFWTYWPLKEFGKLD